MKTGNNYGAELTIGLADASFSLSKQKWEGAINPRATEAPSIKSDDPYPSINLRFTLPQLEGIPYHPFAALRYDDQPYRWTYPLSHSLTPEDVRVGLVRQVSVTGGLEIDEAFISPHVRVLAQAGASLLYQSDDYKERDRGAGNAQSLAIGLNMGAGVGYQLIDGLEVLVRGETNYLKFLDDSAVSGGINFGARFWF